MAAAIGLTGAIAFSQDIPDVLRPDLTIAYTDTDGHGQRGDRRPAGSEKYYPVIDAAITARHRQAARQTVVMTADYSFLSFYPYWGFQGLTSHYANPLAQFDLRAAAIKSWSDLKTARRVHPRAGHAAVDAADGVPDAAAARPGEPAPTPCGWPRTSIPTSPTFAATWWICDASLFADPRFTVPTDRPVRAGHP